MHREGHIGLGLLMYAPIAYVLVLFDLMQAFALGMAAMAFWSFAPDVDMTLPIRHRGPTHTITAAVVSGILTAGVGVYLAAAGTGTSGSLFQSNIVSYLAVSAFAFAIGFLGVLSHLLGDLLTPMGVRPGWPVSNRYHSLDLVLAADETANKGLSIAGAVAVAVALVIASL